MKHIYVLLIVLIFTGCNIKANYKDVSKDEKYSKVIHKTYKNIKPIVLSAHLVDDYKSKEILSYSLSNENAGGRYVLWNKHLIVGSILIIKALECNDFLGECYFLVVEVKNKIFKTHLPVKLYYSLTIIDKDGFIIMNPEYFEEIK